MHDFSLPPPTAVLLAGPRLDEREVLRLALVLHGLRVLEAADIESACRLAEAHAPRVVVLDLELPGCRPFVLCKLAELQQSQGGRLLLLGEAAAIPHSPAVIRASKPYHFAPLVHKIRLLVDGDPPSAARAA